MLSELFLIKQGRCCGHGCLKCPYIPKHSGKTNQFNKDILISLEDWELAELKNEGINIISNHRNFD